MITSMRIVLGVMLAAVLAIAAPASAEEQVFTWQDPEIAESSGLVVVGGKFVTVNDSGNSAKLYIVDPETGGNEEVLAWAKNQVDVEALAPGPDGSVWIGDIGDNDEDRGRITVSLVQLDGGAVARFVLRYPGGRSHNAEALLSHPETGQVFIVTKSTAGGEVYAAPAELDSTRPNRLTLVGSVKGLITDGAFWPDGMHILLRGYGRAFVYRFPSLKILGSFPLPSQQQGEALAVTPEEKIYLSSEGAGTPVWQVELTPDLADRMSSDLRPTESVRPSDRGADPAEATESASASPAPEATGTNAGDEESSVLVILGGLLALVLGLIAGGAWWWRKGSKRP